MLTAIMSNPPVIVVLAAGFGRRFDGARHKLLQSVGPGATVLGLTVQQAIASGLPVVVVTTQPLLPEVAHRVAGRDVVLMPTATNAEEDGIGMGFSIAAGVAARPNAAGWLVLPGDMPLVQARTLRAVAAALPHHPVVYAQYQGRRGHPVAFSAELFSELMQLTGDEGARRIMARYPSQAVEVDDAGVLIDVDTQADLAEVRRRLAVHAAEAAR